MQRTCPWWRFSVQEDGFPSRAMGSFKLKASLVLFLSRLSGAEQQLVLLFQNSGFADRGSYSEPRFVSPGCATPAWWQQPCQAQGAVAACGQCPAVVPSRRRQTDRWHPSIPLSAPKERAGEGNGPCWHGRRTRRLEVSSSASHL